MHFEVLNNLKLCIGKKRATRIKILKTERKADYKDTSLERLADASTL